MTAEGLETGVVLQKRFDVRASILHKLRISTQDIIETTIPARFLGSGKDALRSSSMLTVEHSKRELVNLDRLRHCINPELRRAQLMVYAKPFRNN
jgi:hypothetical protein